MYAAAAFATGVPLGAVLAWTVFARIVRIAPTVLVVTALRGLFGRRIDARPEPWLGALLLFWVFFYALYFSRMGS